MTEGVTAAWPMAKGWATTGVTGKFRAARGGERLLHREELCRARTVGERYGAHASLDCSKHANVHSSRVRKNADEVVAVFVARRADRQVSIEKWGG